MVGATADGIMAVQRSAQMPKRKYTREFKISAVKLVQPAGERAGPTPRGTGGEDRGGARAEPPRVRQPARVPGAQSPGRARLREHGGGHHEGAADPGQAQTDVRAQDDRRPARSTGGGESAGPAVRRAAAQPQVGGR